MDDASETDLQALERELKEFSDRRSPPAVVTRDPVEVEHPRLKPKQRLYRPVNYLGRPELTIWDV